MPIPDEAREALTGAFSFESSRGNVDHRPGYYVNRVDSVLTANGYTVVKLPTEGVLAEAIGSDLDATTLQEDFDAARRVLALLRGEGQ